MAFSKSLQKGQIPVGCELCDGGNKIKFKCLDCEVLMCSKCKDKVHARFKNANLHIIKEIKDLGQQEEVDTFNFSDVKCLDHSDQACCVYCKTCKKVICVKCVTKVHNGHTFIDEEELDDKKKIIRNRQKKAEKSINELSSSSAKLQDTKQQEDSKFTQIKQDILTHRGALKSEVDRCADNLVKDLEKTWKSNNRVIVAEQSKIDKTLANLQKVCETVKSAMTSNDFVNFFCDFDRLAVSLSKDEPLSNFELSLLGRFMPDNITISSFGSVEGGGTLELQQPKIEVKIAKEFTTTFRYIHYMARCSDGSLWIADSISKMVQLIKFDKTSIKIMLELDIQIFGLAVMNASNNLLIVAGGETRLKIINSTTGQITDSNYDLTSFTSFPECVHITNGQRVIVGVGVNGKPAAVIVMDEDGRHLATYDQDSNKEPLFSCPKVITTTKNGNICVLDQLDSYHTRVVVLGKEGEIKQVYTGHPTINNEEKHFSPNAVISTPASSIVIPDYLNSTLHVLNCEGNFIGFYNVYDLGMIYPCSLALSTDGYMYIGCSNREGSPETLEANLFGLEYSGF